MNRPLTIAIVAGEESGDLLAADMILAVKALSGREVRLVGVGGRHLQALGLKALFDPREIALMGFSAVFASLPRLIRRVRQLVSALAAEAPDCLVTIDSPDFGLRVARRIRARAPKIPIIHYVSPSVWAWRPGRAAAMKSYVDHVLCVLPFEVSELRRLGGPPASFVGHRLSTDPGVRRAAALQAMRSELPREPCKTLLLLPGSRRGEVGRLLQPFLETVSELRRRGNQLRILLPTVPNVLGEVRAVIEGFEEGPELIVDPERKWQAFGEADAALIASGTVSLELALAGVPMVSCYKLDPLARIAQGWITTWSALLPNLIADRPIAPEFYNGFVRPNYLARLLEQLVAETPLRAWQKEGFAEVARRLATPRPSGELAAEAVLGLVGPRQLSGALLSMRGRG